MDKEKSLEILNYAKNVWNAAHEIAKNSKIFKKAHQEKKNFIFFQILYSFNRFFTY